MTDRATVRSWNLTCPTCHAPVSAVALVRPGVARQEPCGHEVGCVQMERKG